MALWTTFLSNLLQVFADSDDQPFSPQVVSSAVGDDRYDTLALHVFSFNVAASQTVVTPIIPGYAATEWGYVWVRATGTVQVIMAALDTDGITPITWQTTIFGTAKWPGVFQVATTNLTGLSFLGVAASSQVEMFQSVIAPPTDARVIANLGGGVPVAPMAGNTNQNLAPGLMPIGGIIAFSGSFDATQLPGGYSELGLLPLPAWMKLCDGSLIANAASPINGRYVPNLTDNRFLQGSVAGGIYAGNTANQANLAHTHDFPHTHNVTIAFLAGQMNDPVYTTAAHTHAVTVGFTAGQINDPVYHTDPHTHTTGVSFNSGQITQATYTLSNHTHGFSHVHQWAFSNPTEVVTSKSAIDKSSTTITGGDTQMMQDVTATAGGGQALQLTNASSTWYTTGALNPPQGGSGSAAATDFPSNNNATLNTGASIPNQNFTSGNQSVNTLSLVATGSIPNQVFTTGTQSSNVVNLAATGSIPPKSFTTVSQSALATNANTVAALVDIRPLYLQVKYYMRIY